MSSGSSLASQRLSRDTSKFILSVRLANGRSQRLTHIMFYVRHMKCLYCPCSAASTMIARGLPGKMKADADRTIALKERNGRGPGVDRTRAASVLPAGLKRHRPSPTEDLCETQLASDRTGPPLSIRRPPLPSGVFDPDLRAPLPAPPQAKTCQNMPTARATPAPCPRHARASVLFPLACGGDRAAPRPLRPPPAVQVRHDDTAVQRRAAGHPGGVAGRCPPGPREPYDHFRFQVVKNAKKIGPKSRFFRLRTLQAQI
eukprot:gene22828-biopygen16287